MLRWLASTIHRRCAFCGERVPGEGLRRGLRVFCSPAHLREYLEEWEIKSLHVSRMMKHLMRNRRGGCC